MWIKSEVNVTRTIVRDSWHTLLVINRFELIVVYNILYTFICIHQSYFILYPIVFATYEIMVSERRATILKYNWNYIFCNRKSEEIWQCLVFCD